MLAHRIEVAAMLQNSPARGSSCDERAPNARERTQTAITVNEKADFRAAERCRKSGKVTAFPRLPGLFLDPDGVAAVTAAYDSVLAELNLPHREDAGTRMVAKRVIELAARGERNAQRLAESTLKALCR
jgi:hypothetical protein